jgi:micrococcal nuclease
MRRAWIIATALLALLSATACVAALAAPDELDFSGVVTRVFDGDSLIVTAALHGRSQRIEVRLLDIDAPEKDQPYADDSRAVLVRLIEGRRVFVDVVGTDRYARKIAKVYREADRLDVTRALVHDGHVWVNRKFAQDVALVTLEDQARSKHIGLWALPRERLVPPWQFRRERKAKATTR